MPDPDRTRFRTALWEIDPTGERPARRLTRGSGETAPAFLPDGDLLFTSARPDPDRPKSAREPAEDAPAALWRLPVAGEAHVVGTRAGGDRRTGRRAGRGHRRRRRDDAARRRHRRGRRGPPQGPPGEEDQRDPARRAPRAVLGPRSRAGREAAAGGHRARRRNDRVAGPHPRAGTGRRRLRRDPRRRHRRRRMGGVRRAAAPDARRWWPSTSRPGRGGCCSTTPPPTSCSPAISPDGTRVACVRETRSTPTAPIDRVLLVVPLHGGEPTPSRPTGTAGPRSCAGPPTARRSSSPPTTRAVARSSASSPGADPVRLTGDDGFYSDLVAAPDGSRALRPAQRRRRPARPGAARPAGARPAPGAATRALPSRRTCPAPSRRSPRPPPTAPRCAPGSRCRKRAGRRCCCGSTAARWAAGTPGSGGGTRG